MTTDFRVFQGDGQVPPVPRELHPSPSWRAFAEPGIEDAKCPDAEVRDWARIRDEKVIDLINAGLALRRPLLVTGRPGSGKSTLAKMIAAELSLGEVLWWPITSSSRLREALYEYDAIGRLQDSKKGAEPGTPVEKPDIGRYIRLGPLGTALLPRRRPRVLLVDEIDKSDIDLPNDLLHVFETGQFDIPELLRLPDSAEPVEVMTHDRGVRLNLEMPDRDGLAEIVHKQVPAADDVKVNNLIKRFEERQGDGRYRAIDQLLNAIHLIVGAKLDEESGATLIDEMFRDLGEGTS
jgi:MoxR-like ATPase